MGVQCCRVQCSCTGTGISFVGLHWKGNGHRRTPCSYLSWETHCKLLGAMGCGWMGGPPMEVFLACLRGNHSITLPTHVPLCLGPALLVCSPKALVPALKARQPRGIGTVTAWQFSPTSAVQGCCLLTSS